MTSRSSPRMGFVARFSPRYNSDRSAFLSACLLIDRTRLATSSDLIVTSTIGQAVARVIVPDVGQVTDLAPNSPTAPPAASWLI